jgi:hypothetical protein
VELKSSAQNQRLRKNLIDYNWAWYGARIHVLS